MNGVYLLLMLGVLLPIVFCSALAGHSLRDFSRSRLEEICRKRKQEQRFGTILRLHEQALLGWDIVCVVSLVTLFMTSTLYLGIIPRADGVWQPWLIFQAALVMIALAFVSVILPWTVSRVAGEPFLYLFWPTTRGMLTAMKPVIWLAGWLDTIVHRLSGRKEPEDGDAANITEEILTVVEEGQREGVLESEARTMIRRVMELQEDDVADIMVPRTDMYSIQVDSTLEMAREKLLEAGHSRVPIIGESPDDIIGILYAKDLLNYLNNQNGPPATLRDIVREPFYIPETTGIDTLLQMMKAKRVHLAVVLDEYGGVAGLVTMEDILEEIVGDIVDEFDATQADQFRTVSASVTEVDARVHVDDVNERLGLELPDDRDFDTIGGFVFSVLGRIPISGESFQWQETGFTILEADKRKISRVRIEKEQPVEASSTRSAKQA